MHAKTMTLYNGTWPRESPLRPTFGRAGCPGSMILLASVLYQPLKRTSRFNNVAKSYGSYNVTYSSDMAHIMALIAQICLTATFTSFSAQASIFNP